MGDVVDHLLGKACGLLLGNGPDDLTGLVSLLGSKPSLGGVGLDVVLAVDVGGIDSGLLESGVDRLLHELLPGLLNGHLELVVDD